MVFPIIPIVAAAAVVLGGGAIIWYSGLTAEEKEKADLRANELSLEWFGTALDKLSKVNFMRILIAVKREITDKKEDNPPVGRAGVLRTKHPSPSGDRES